MHLCVCAGEIGKLFFTQHFASSFDSHPKTWKMVGEVLSTLGSALQLYTVIAPPSLFLLLASVGNTARSIAYLVYCMDLAPPLLPPPLSFIGVARSHMRFLILLAASTDICFTRSFALVNNVGTYLKPSLLV